MTENYVQYRSNGVIRNLLEEIRLELDLECLDWIWRSWGERMEAGWRSAYRNRGRKV